MSQFVLFARAGRHVALHTPDKELILAEEYTSEKVPGRWGASYTAVALFLEVCKGTPLIYNWRNNLLGRPRTGAPWRQLSDVHAINHILQSHLRLVSIPAGADYDELSSPNPPEDASLSERLTAARFFVHDTLQMAFCQQILAAVADVPEVVGFLAHPIYGVPEERWLYPEAPK